MEFDFRQQVAQGNADKHACRHRHRRGDEQAVILRDPIGANMEQHDTQRTHERIAKIDQRLMAFRPTASRHQRCDRKRIERFVKRDAQQGAESRQPPTKPTESMLVQMQMRRIGREVGAERETVEQRVQREAEKNPQPTGIRRR